MNRILFAIGLSMGFLAIYIEYLWMKNHYRSFVFVASKCPKTTTIDEQHRTTIQSFVPVTCQTIEIHTDPRTIFLLIKLSSLMAVIWSLLSVVRHRTKKISSSMKSISGDTLPSEIIKESLGLRTKITVVEKHR